MTTADSGLAPEQLTAATDEALAAVAAATDLPALAAVRTAVLGDRSPIALARRALGSIPGPERAEAGKRVNAASVAVTSAHDARKAVLEDERDARVLVEEAVDVTALPGRAPVGARHPLTTVQERAVDAFVAMGWEVAEGPEVEHEWFNFDASTSARTTPPARCRTPCSWPPRAAGSSCAPTPARSRCARCSAASCRSTSSRPVASSAPMPSTPRTRRSSPSSRASASTRASRWPTCAAPSTPSPWPCSGRACAPACGRPTSRSPKPSAELDLQCFHCLGASAKPGGEPCRVCSSEGWIEVGGCGMVNPRVLVAAGVDPERYSGFAFGMGLDRTLMFRHGATDIRDFYEGDQRFSLPFGSEA